MKRKSLVQIKTALLLVVVFILLVSAFVLTMALTSRPEKSSDELYRESHLPQLPTQ